MRLSICIATYNRGQFIGETLDSIISQLRPEVEVVIVDGASPDNTAEVVAPFASRCAAIRYFRETVNSGVDADYDKAVQYANGDFCWLATDDDLLVPGAIDRVLSELDDEVDLLIVDAEIRDFSLRRVLQTRRLPVVGERDYGLDDRDTFLTDAGDALSFIGGTIFRRSLWLTREREQYFGSLFIHVAAIFQSPVIPRIRVLGEPLVRIRLGNAMWRPRSFEIWAFKWPTLIWSFGAYGDKAKSRVTAREPWRDFRWISRFRSMGVYSIAEYRRWFADRSLGSVKLMLWLVAVAPGAIANFLGACFLAVQGKGSGEAMYDLVVCSRFSNPATRMLGRIWLGDLPPRST